MTQAEPSLEDLAPDAVTADKGYDSDAFVGRLEARDITPVIPPTSPTPAVAVEQYESLMSQVKQQRERYFFSACTRVKLGYAVDCTEQRTGPEDVGEHALMCGLDTHFRFFVWGCPGLISGIE